MYTALSICLTVKYLKGHELTRIIMPTYTCVKLHTALQEKPFMIVVDVS
jgi:hypothetical protein